MARTSIRSKLFLSHFLAVVLVSGSIGTYFYRQATGSLMESLRTRLEYSAGLLSRALDAGALDALSTPADMARPEYQRHLDLLREFQSANRDVAFIYVMRRDGDQVRFVLDSDASAEQARPGDPYDSVLPRLLEGFERPAADDEIARDRWGFFLSGYAPLKNGAGRYLVGIDMRADQVQAKFQSIRLAGLVSLLASVLFAALFSQWLAARITRPLSRVIERTAEIARGELSGEVRVATRDELESLAEAVNRMAADLLDSQRRREQAIAELADANATLESRIDERTREITEVNSTLRAEIEERKLVESRLERAATVDFLTGLLNRAAMLRLLDQELERMRRTTAPFALVLADLDFFKPINDRFGHGAGDETLLRVAAILRGALRGQDALCRWGGDELMFFLPETTLAGAAEVAEKARRRLAEEILPVEGLQIQVTLSLGVAEARLDEPVRDLIHRADAALYRAKLEGRNRVSLAA